MLDRNLRAVAITAIRRLLVQNPCIKFESMDLAVGIICRSEGYNLKDLYMGFEIDYSDEIARVDQAIVSIFDEYAPKRESVVRCYIGELSHDCLLLKVSRHPECSSLTVELARLPDARIVDVGYLSDFGFLVGDPVEPVRE